VLLTNCNASDVPARAERPLEHAPTLNLTGRMEIAPLFKAAGEAALAAKRGGRNRIVQATDVPLAGLALG
jgi:hypothetical protein